MRVTDTRSMFFALRGTIAGPAPEGDVMVVIDGERIPLRFGQSSLEVVVGDRSETNLTGAE